MSIASCCCNRTAWCTRKAIEGMFTLGSHHKLLRLVGVTALSTWRQIAEGEKAIRRPAFNVRNNPET